MLKEATPNAPPEPVAVPVMRPAVALVISAMFIPRTPKASPDPALVALMVPVFDVTVAEPVSA